MMKIEVNFFFFFNVIVKYHRTNSQNKTVKWPLNLLFKTRNSNGKKKRNQIRIV